MLRLISVMFLSALISIGGSAAPIDTLPEPAPEVFAIMQTNFGSFVMRLELSFDGSVSSEILDLKWHANGVDSEWIPRPRALVATISSAVIAVLSDAKVLEGKPVFQVKPNSPACDAGETVYNYRNPVTGKFVTFYQETSTCGEVNHNNIRGQTFVTLELRKIIEGLQSLSKALPPEPEVREP